MGDKKDQTKPTTGSMPRESSQVGTHGQTAFKQGVESPGKSEGQGMRQGQSDWKEGQGAYPGQAIKRDQGDWNDRAQRDMQQGDETRPAQPSGTSPLDKDEHPVNRTRPVQQNR